MAGYARTARELVHSASLAASSHNSQPWKFRCDRQGISIVPDFSRRCPAVDPDDHHLFVSLGCAAENLILAACAAGMHADTVFNPTIGGGEIRIQLTSQSPYLAPLATAISTRQCTRTEYDGRSVPLTDLKLLEAAGTTAGCGVALLTDGPSIRTIADFVAQGNVAQFDDRAFVDELIAWVRFNKSEARRLADGLSAQASGSPGVPRWLGSRFLRSRFASRKQIATDLKRVQSSAGIAIFASDHNEKAGWIDVGRSYQRFALQATALGIRNAFINQPVEVAGIRSKFASWLGLGHRRPDLVVRFGYGPQMPPSLRRPLDDIIVLSEHDN
jgi:hypothetical protein